MREAANKTLDAQYMPIITFPDSRDSTVLIEMINIGKGPAFNVKQYRYLSVSKEVLIQPKTTRITLLEVGNKRKTGLTRYSLDDFKKIARNKGEKKLLGEIENNNSHEVILALYEDCIRNKYQTWGYEIEKNVTTIKFVRENGS